MRLFRYCQRGERLPVRSDREPAFSEYSLPRAGAEKHPWDLTDDEVKQISWAEVRQYVQDGEDLLLSPEAQKTAKKRAGHGS